MVWLGMTQEALDAAYDQAVYAPNLDQVLARHAANSRRVREVLGEPRRFAYGEKGIEGLDVFAAGANGAPILIFVHGGSWRFGVAAENAFVAEPFVNAGIHVVIPDFSSVDDVNGDLAGLVDQLQCAVQWVYHHANDFGGNQEQIYLAGFSSGAHLAGVLLTLDWTADGLPADVFKGALLCSGMYDLAPVALSYRSEFVTLNSENIPQLSPQQHLEKLTMPLIVAYGTQESPEFKRQADEFVEALQAAGNPVQLVIGEQYNHFEIIETMGSPCGILGRKLLQLIADSITG